MYGAIEMPQLGGWMCMQMYSRYYKLIAVVDEIPGLLEDKKNRPDNISFICAHQGMFLKNS